MGIQAKTSEWDHRLYSVNRDLAHNYTHICQETARRLEAGSWPIVTRMCADYKITEDELGEACRAYLEFIGTSVSVKEDREPQQGLTRVGWFALRDEVQVIFMAMLSTVVMGYAYVGIREATLGGKGPIQDGPDLLAEGRRVADALSLPRWQRRWQRFRYKVKTAVLRRLGAEPQVKSLLVEKTTGLQAVPKDSRP